MKTIFIIFMSVMIISSCYAQAPSILVTPAWVAEHIKDKDLVVLHVAGNRRDYSSGHIPGARYLWTGWMALSNPELSFELVPADQMTTTLRGLGISNNSRIVLCSSNGNVSATARMFITFDYLGMGDRTYILDGGIEAWKADGHEATKEVPVVKRGLFRPKLKENTFVNADYVKEHLDNSGFRILDARAPDFYSGKNSGGFPRAGHIPGAQNIYFNTLFDTTNKYLPLDSLKAKFDRAGVKSDNEVISYCHVGQTASPLYIVARMLGYNAHLYDGSFEDWSGRTELPIESPPKQ